MADILDQIDGIFKKNITKVINPGDKVYIEKQYNAANGPVAKGRVLAVLNSYIKKQ